MELPSLPEFSRAPRSDTTDYGSPTWMPDGSLGTKRKSTKGAKERKQRRKEENAKLSASQLKVDAANKLEDPMSVLLPFKKFERNGVCLDIECKRVDDLDQETVEFVFQLCKKNMQTLYESCDWGWKDREKREEMTEDKAWYLIVRDQEKKPVAFVHFRFDIEIDEEVLYCYEIQLSDGVQRKGLGKFLMQILELLAYKTEMVKVMLTTFKHNEVGVKFFQEALKYEVDETSPDDPVYEEGYCYWILSKKIKPQKSKTRTPAKETENKENVTEKTVNGATAMATS